MVSRRQFALVFAFSFTCYFSAPEFVLAEIYRWVDKKGQTHFGNVPPNLLKAYKPGFSASEFNADPEQGLAPRQPTAASKASPSKEAKSKQSTSIPFEPTEKLKIHPETRRIEVKDLESPPAETDTKASPESKTPIEVPTVEVVDERCGIFNLYVGEYEGKLRDCNGNVCETYAHQLERYRDFLRKNCRE